MSARLESEKSTHIPQSPRSTVRPAGLGSSASQRVTPVRSQAPHSWPEQRTCRNTRACWVWP